LETIKKEKMMAISIHDKLELRNEMMKIEFKHDTHKHSAYINICEAFGLPWVGSLPSNHVKFILVSFSFSVQFEKYRFRGKVPLF